MREVAGWMTRVSALLPAGLSVASEHGFVSFSCDPAANGCTAPSDARWDDRSLSVLFTIVASAVHARAADVSRARVRDAKPRTVQIGSIRDAHRAELLAARVNAEHDAGRIDSHGFINVGGFPSSNPIAHVQTATVRGVRMHRVLIDAFLDADEARATRDSVARAIGARGFLRAL